MCFGLVVSGYIGEFEIVDDHRAGKIVVKLTGRLNKVCTVYIILDQSPSQTVTVITQS